MALVQRTAVARAASTAAPTATPTSEPAQTVIFETPSLTTTFTPPPECTSQHLTMLEAQEYFVWMNEPQPVPDTVFSSCYPKAFMTSYLQQKSSTIAPAFSPLVCPDNYQTVYNQTITNRPLYVACCPSNFGFAPPKTSAAGRPAYGGTCYSDLMSTTITQYDNSSSSGVMTWTSTGGQAYAHPIDGFAFDAETGTDVILASVTDTALYTGAFPTFTQSAEAAATESSETGATSSHSTLPTGAIAGIAVGGAAFLALLGLLFFCLGRRRKLSKDYPEHETEQARSGTFHTGPKSPPAGASIRSGYHPEKVLPPEPAYTRRSPGTKAHEMGTTKSIVQELPATTPHELAARTPEGALLAPSIMASAARGYSTRTSRAASEDGFQSSEATFVGPQSHTSLSEQHNWPKPPSTVHSRNESRNSERNPFRSPTLGQEPDTPQQSESGETYLSAVSPGTVDRTTSAKQAILSPVSPEDEKEKRKKHKRQISYGW